MTTEEVSCSLHSVHVLLAFLVIDRFLCSGGRLVRMFASVGFVFYGGLCSDSTNKLAALCCVLFGLFVCVCVCISCLSDSLIDCLCVLIPILPESPVVLFPPFSQSTTFSHFFSSGPSPSLSHAGSFTSTSTLTSSPSPTVMCSLLSLSPCMALCCCHNARGQAMRSLSTGELQAWLNLDHPHHHPED